MSWAKSHLKPAERPGLARLLGLGRSRNITSDSDSDSRFDGYFHLDNWLRQSFFTPGMVEDRRLPRDCAEIPSKVVLDTLR